MAVYKDKKRGTWYTSFPYVDWTGKRCRKLKRGFLTKKEAQNWENHFKLQKANSLDMTFEDFYGIYEADVKPKIRYNTWCTKEHIIKTKILPYFKDLSMRDITPRDIIKWQNIMRESINNKGKEYTGTYLKTVQAQLSSIFNHAVRFYELPNNPVRVAGPMGQNESDEMKFWTKEEYMKFIPTMANKTYSYMAFELLYWCGIRLGELRALTTADFDFDTNMLSITKSYQRIKGEDIITKPKTKRSIRKVIMPETVANEMKDFIDSIYDPGMVTKTELEQLVNGGTIIQKVDEMVTYKDLYSNIDNLWSTLFMTGYLTQRGQVGDGYYCLAVPNREICNIIIERVLTLFRKEVSQNGELFRNFCNALTTCNASAVERILTEYMSKTISVRDNFAKSLHENFYHGLMIGILGYRRDWKVLSNRESGDGFSDIMIEVNDTDTNIGLGIVIELKYSSEERDLELDCREALNQIKNKNYTQELRNRGFNKIIKYGISFCRKKCRVMTIQE